MNSWLRKLIDMTKFGLESSVMDVLSTNTTALQTPKQNVCRRNKKKKKKKGRLHKPGAPGNDTGMAGMGSSTTPCWRDKNFFQSAASQDKPLEMLVHGGWDRARVDLRATVMYSYSNCHSGSWIASAFLVQRGEKVW